MRNKYTWIDPPNGWRYGFPKRFLTSKIQDKQLSEVCIENGYPKEMIIEPFIYRCWEEEL